MGEQGFHIDLAFRTNFDLVGIGSEVPDAIVRLNPFSADGLPFAFERGGLETAVILPYGSSRACDGTVNLSSTPNPDQFCVCVGGNAFIVDTRPPVAVTDLNAYEACELKPIPHKGLLLIVDYTRLIALGESGIVWTTPSVSDDRMYIDEITDNSIVLACFDSAEGEYVLRLVRLADGKPLV